MNEWGKDSQFWDDALQDVLGDAAFRESLSRSAAKIARQRRRRRRAGFAALSSAGAIFIAGLFVDRQAAPPLPPEVRPDLPLTIVHTAAGRISHVSTRAGGVELVATADAPPRFDPISDPELLELFVDFSPRIERDDQGMKRLVLAR